MNLCFVTPRFPYPTVRGDQVRTYHQIRTLSERHRITLVAGYDRLPNTAARTEMERWCERIETVPLGGFPALFRLAGGALTTRLPLQVLYYASPAFHRVLARTLATQHYDLVHASLIRTAPYVMNIAPPVVIDLTDALGRSIAARIPHAPPPLRALYAFEGKRVERYERELCKRFPRLVVSAQADAVALQVKNVTVIPNAVNAAAFPFAPDQREDDLIIMTGNMGYHPNVDGAVWFATEIFPIIRQARPGARLRLVGARPSPAVRALERLPGVTVTGEVPNIYDHLRQATMAVCPIRCGSGIQNKVLEAMSSGTPLISTPHGNEGVGALPEHELLIAGDAQTFARASIALLNDPKRRRELAHAAHDRILRDFTWEQHARSLEAVYAQAFSAHASS
jgi:sugar transferase (PEP-CTERM/EpsH1 system associated)